MSLEKVPALEKLREMQQHKLIEVLRTEEGVDVRETNSDEFSGAVRMNGLEALDEKGQEILETLVAECRNYYTGVVMDDKFGADHTARRAWRELMIQKHGHAFEELIARNKLRANVFSRISSGINILVREFDAKGIHTLEAEKLRDFQKQFPKLVEKPFSFLSEDEQLEVVQQVDAVARGVLELVTEPKAGVRVAA